MSSPQVLVDSLVDESESNYVRVVAHWLTRAQELNAEPELTGNQLIDTLVAAATAHKAQLVSADIPSWTNLRCLPNFWHPGSDAFFSYSLAHSPQTFTNRGILIEEESLVSI